MTRGRTKPLFTPVQRNILTVPGMPGGHLSSTEIEPISFIQPIAYVAKDDNHALRIKDELAEWLITDKPAPLQFDDEPGRTYYAIVQNTIEDFERIAVLRQGAINFLCLDPFSYGKEQSYPFSSVPMDDGVGRNLIRNSDFSDGTTGFVLYQPPSFNGTVSFEEGIIKITSPDSSFGGFYVAYGYRPQTLAGQHYTITIWAKGSGTMYIGQEKVSGGQATVVVSSDEFMPYSHSYSPDETSNNPYSFYVNSKTDGIYVNSIKLEKGDIATDPTPAPEDRPSDILTLNYGGTAPASPIFELEVLKPVTFAMVQNQFEEYQLIGTPLEADMETVDTRKLLIEERGETLDTWSNTPTKVDGGVVAGRLSTDNDGITVPSYGPDTKKWHGPALIKEISPSQDFEIEMMVEGETGKPDQTYRIEFYAYDENMNVLGKMALLDKSLGINNKIAEGRIGGYEGRQQNYLISSQNYSYGWPFFFGMLRLRRIGNQFEFYVTRVANNTKHVFSLKKLFTDNNNEYMGKLRYVQIHIGKWADSARAYAPKILHIKVFKLAQETVDQTPYIANPGDKITLDNLKKEILINGEDAKNLKDFGGSFFNLHKGDNQLVVHPSNSFKATAKWRNRYR